MKMSRDIKTTMDRTMQALALKPALGRQTKVATACLTAGVSCRISEGEWSYTTDMPESSGGNGTGASPGSFARMAFGSCLATGYGMWFAQMEIPFDAIQVEVEGDLDYSGMFGIDPDAAPGHTELRVRVNIVSPAPAADVQRAVDKAERLSPLMHLVSKPIPVKRELVLTAPAEPVQALRQA